MSQLTYVVHCTVTIIVYRISLNRLRAGSFFQAQDSVASSSRARVKQGCALYTSELPRPA